MVPFRCGALATLLAKAKSCQVAVRPSLCVARASSKFQADTVLQQCTACSTSSSGGQPGGMSSSSSGGTLRIQF